MAAPAARGVRTVRRAARIRLLPEPAAAKRTRRTREPVVVGLHHEPVTVNGTGPMAAVIDALRAWRLDQARARAVAPFVILHDRALIAIATLLPRSVDELRAVPGIGPGKLAVYGDAILAVVAAAISTQHR
jgi:superfamily II DNA helicase RecQ